MSDAQQSTDFLDFLKDDFEVLPDNRHPAVAQIEQFLPRISNLSLLAKNLSVENAPQCSNALDLTADIRKISKSVDELRKQASDPARRMVQMINDAARGLQEILHVAENELKFKIAVYQKKEDSKQAKAQEAVKALSEELGIDIIVPNEAKNVHSAKATTYTKEVLSFEVTDLNLIPDDYWVIDDRLIQKHIDLGKKDIPGIKIIKDKKFVVRSK